MTKPGRKPVQKPLPENKPGDPKKKPWWDFGGYSMLLLGLLLFTVGGMFNNAPLKGQHKMLVASSDIADKQLQKAVVFIIRHDRGGAQGFIVNRPGAKGEAGFGGTQEPARLFALHTLDVQLPETIAMQDVGLGIVEGKDAIEKLKKASPKPAWFIVVHGYEGWGTRQMEAEISSSVWQLVEFDKDALTKTPPAKFWEVARHLPKFVMTH